MTFTCQMYNGRLVSRYSMWDISSPKFPASIGLAKGRPRFILPTTMLAWSIVTICMPAVKQFWGFCLCRYLIGVLEGPFFPGIALLTSYWYTKSETSYRMAIWHAGNIISNAFSGLLAAAILPNMNNVETLVSWQWFFI